MTTEYKINAINMGVRVRKVDVILVTYYNVV
jgi:hypothetical protein